MIQEAMIKRNLSHRSTRLWNQGFSFMGTSSSLPKTPSCLTQALLTATGFLKKLRAIGSKECRLILIKGKWFKESFAT